MRNIAEDDSKVELSLDELAGLSETMLEKLAKVPGKPDHRYVSMKAPEVTPAMRDIKNETVRRRLLMARSSVAAENVEILEDLVEKRTKLARELNSTSYSRMVTKSLMSKTPETVQAFEEKLANRIMSQGRK